MGCCQAYEPRPPYYHIQQPQQLYQPVKERSQQIVVEPTFVTHTNVDKTKEKDYRLERLLQDHTFIDDYRCEYVLNYLVIDNKEQFFSVKGDLYFFDKILYFYCPTQVQVHPYGEFIRFIEKDQILIIVRQTEDKFRVVLKTGVDFMFKFDKNNQNGIVERLIELAKELKLPSQL